MSVQKSIIAQTYLLDTPSSIKVCSAGFFCPESVTAELCTIAPIYIQADLLKRQSISLSILLALHKKTLCFIHLSYLSDDVMAENTESVKGYFLYCLICLLCFKKQTTPLPMGHFKEYPTMSYFKI